MRKTAVLGAVFLACCIARSPGRAIEIDGVTYRDPVVLKEFPDRIFIGHADGQLFVERAKLSTSDLSVLGTPAGRGHEESFEQAMKLLAGDNADGKWSQAVEMLLTAGESGLPAAQRELGRMYAEGLFVRQNSARAYDWTEKAAEAGDAQAQRMLGDFHRQGVQVPQDSAEAVVWYRLAAEQGDAIAMVRLAHAHLEGAAAEADPAGARELYRQAERVGDTQGLAFLGMDYLRMAKLGTDKGAERLGFTRDELYRKAANPLRKASAAGDIGAKHALGMLMIRGEGFGRNLQRGEKMCAEAVDLAKREIAKGSVIWRMELAQILGWGLGVPADRAEAMRLLQEVIKLTDSSALRSQAEFMTARLHAGENWDDPSGTKEALVWLEKARKSGHPQAAAAIEKIKALRDAASAE